MIVSSLGVSRNMGLSVGRFLYLDGSSDWTSSSRSLLLFMGKEVNSHKEKTDPIHYFTGYIYLEKEFLNPKKNYEITILLVSIYSLNCQLHSMTCLQNGFCFQHFLCLNIFTV